QSKRCVSPTPSLQYSNTPFCPRFLLLPGRIECSYKFVSCKNRALTTARQRGVSLWRSGQGRITSKPYATAARYGIEDVGSNTQPHMRLHGRGIESCPREG